MKHVVVVGAGATLAEALPSRPSRENRPPLDATFFKICHLAKSPTFGQVQRYMNQNYGFDLVSADHRMEEVFNYIYSDAYSVSPPRNCHDAYWSLIRMYASTIGRTTNKLTGTSYYGIGALLRYLWKRDPDPEISFITFNQDLVIEKAIQRATETKTYSHIPWNLQIAYSNEFDEWSRMAARSNEFSTSGDDSVKVLKLHGSLNWVYTVRSDSDPKNSIRDPSGNLICLNDEVVYRGLRYRPTQKMVHLIPLVVPPIYEKASRYQEILGPLWVESSKEISNADNLIIFGYSFPESDMAARSLFRRSLYKNKDISEVSIIDTNPHLVPKITNLLELPTIHYHQDVPSYKTRNS